MSSTYRWATVAALCLCVAATVVSAAEGPVTVSPGSPSGLELTDSRCPTFSWGAPAGATSSELVVYRIGEEGSEPVPVLRRRFSGSVASWTPSLDRCLDRGGRYAWAVRVMGPEEVSDWSRLRLFKVAAAPDEAESLRALALVEKSLLSDEAVEKVEGGSARAASADAARMADAVPEAPDSASLTSGVVIADDGITLGGEPVVTAATDRDTLGGLSCPDGQVAKWNGGAAQWECAADQDTLAALGCSGGELAKWNGSLSQWECAADADDDTLSSLACPDGQIARWNASLAQWQCADDLDTDTDTLADLTCADGQVAKWNVALAQWQCAEDVDTDTDTNTDTLADLSCADGEVARWNDAASQWQCAADQTGDTSALEEELCRLYLQTGQLPLPSFCDLDPVNGSLDITGQPLGQVAVNPALERVYVGGNYSLGSQPLLVIDVSDKDAPTLVTTLTGAGAAANSTTNRFYAKGGTGIGGGTFLVYNGADNSLFTSVPVGYCGGRFAADETTNLVYMTSQCGGGNDPLHVLDGATNTVVGGPLGSGGVVGGVRVNSATGNAYVWRSGGTRVFGPSPGFAFVTDLSGIYIQAVNPVTNRLYFSIGSDLEVRSGVDHSLITTITGQGSVIGVNTTRNRIYVSDQANQVVNVIDGSTNAVIGNIPLGTGVTPSIGAVDSTRNRLYVTGTAAGSTLVYVVTDTVP